MGYTGGRGRPPDAPARIGLRVSPGAGRNEVVGRHGKVWKVRIAARAERGRANDALVEFLAETLGVPRRSVVLVAGAGRRDKVVEVAGMTNDEADRRLAVRQRKGTS